MSAARLALGLALSPLGVRAVRLAEDSLTAVGEPFEDMCSYKTVSDPDRCGGKSSCEVLDECWATIRMHLSGEADLASLANVQVNGGVSSWEALNAPQIVQDILATYSDDMTQKFNQLVSKLTTMAKEQLIVLKNTLLAQIGGEASADSGFGGTLSALLSSDAAKRIKEAIMEAVDNTKVDFTLDAPAAPTVSGDPYTKNMCDKWLRVSVKNGRSQKDIVIKDWRNVLVGQKLHFGEECSTALVANCETGTVTEYTRCPVGEEQAHKRCMPSLRCPRRRPRLVARRKKPLVVRVPDGSGGFVEEGIEKGSVRISTVRQNWGKDHEVLDEPELFDFDAHYEGDTSAADQASVEMTGIVDVVTREACSSAASTFAGLPVVAYGCRALARVAAIFGRTFYHTIPIDADTFLPVQFRLKVNRVSATFVPMWDELGEKLETLVMEGAAQIPDLPVGLDVQGLNLDFDGVEQKILLKSGSYVDTKLTINMDNFMAEQED